MFCFLVLFASSSPWSRPRKGLPLVVSFGKWTTSLRFPVLKLVFHIIYLNISLWRGYESAPTKRRETTGSNCTFWRARSSTWMFLNVDTEEISRAFMNFKNLAVCSVSFCLLSVIFGYFIKMNFLCVIQVQKNCAGDSLYPRPVVLPGPLSVWGREEKFIPTRWNSLHFSRFCTNSVSSLNGKYTHVYNYNYNSHKMWLCANMINSKLNAN